MLHVVLGVLGVEHTLSLRVLRHHLAVKHVVIPHVRSLRQPCLDPLWEVLIQCINVFSLGSVLGAIFKLNLEHLHGVSRDEFGSVQLTVGPTHSNCFARRRRTEHQAIVTRDILGEKVVAVRSIIKIDLVEGLRGQANHVTVIIAAVFVLGNDGLSDGYVLQGISALRALRAGLVPAARDVDGVRPVVRLHEDAGSVGTRHVERRRAAAVRALHARPLHLPMLLPAEDAFQFPPGRRDAANVHWSPLHYIHKARLSHCHRAHHVHPSVVCGLLEGASSQIAQATIHSPGLRSTSRAFPAI